MPIATNIMPIATHNADRNTYNADRNKYNADRNTYNADRSTYNADRMHQPMRTAAPIVPPPASARTAALAPPRPHSRARCPSPPGRLLAARPCFGRPSAEARARVASSRRMPTVWARRVQRRSRGRLSRSCRRLSALRVCAGRARLCASHQMRMLAGARGRARHHVCTCRDT